MEVSSYQFRFDNLSKLENQTLIEKVTTHSSIPRSTHFPTLTESKFGFKAIFSRKTMYFFGKENVDFTLRSDTNVKNQ